MRAHSPARHLPWALVALLALLAPAARASCGAEDCPISAHGHDIRKGSWAFDLLYQYIDQDGLQIGTRDAVVGELPSPEDEVRTTSSIVSLVARGSLSQRLRLSLSLPYIDRVHEHIAHEEGQPDKLQHFAYSGLGDLLISTQMTVLGGETAGSATLDVLFGLELPTGATEVTAVDGDQPEPPARPGSGSLDALVGLHAMRPLRSFGKNSENGLFMGLLARRNGSGTEHYRIGSELQASGGGSYALGSRTDLLAQLNLRVRDKDDPGDTDAIADHTGGTWLYVSPGLRVGSTLGFSVYGYAQIPVYQNVNGIQLVSPYHLLIGASYSLAR